MGWFGGFFFGEKDSILVKEIAKEHKASAEVVEKHYKKMLKEINDELQNKTQD